MLRSVYLPYSFCISIDGSSSGCQDDTPSTSVGSFTLSSCVMPSQSYLSPCSVTSFVAAIQRNLQSQSCRPFLEGSSMSVLCLSTLLSPAPWALTSQCRRLSCFLSTSPSPNPSVVSMTTRSFRIKS